MWKISNISAQEIIEQIRALPPNERAQVTKFVVESDDSWIPEEFKQGMADIAAGRVVELDAAMKVPFPEPSDLSLAAKKTVVKHVPHLIKRAYE